MNKVRIHLLCVCLVLNLFCKSRNTDTLNTNLLQSSLSDILSLKPKLSNEAKVTIANLTETNVYETLKKYIGLKNIPKQAELYNIIAKNYLLANNSLSIIQSCNSSLYLKDNDYLNLSNSYFILSEVYALNSDYQQSQTYFKLFTGTKTKYVQSSNEQAKLRNENESKVTLLHVDAEDEISSIEKKGLELVRIKLESRQKEQEILLIKQENEVKEKAIQTQILEKKQALKSLELIKNQLENEKLTKEFDRINREKEIKGLQNEKNKSQIKLLNSRRKIDISEKAIKDLEIQSNKKKQQYLLIGMTLLGIFLALISFGFYTNYKQKKIIENTNSELQIIGENLRSSNTKLEDSFSEINEQKKIIEDKNSLIIDSINYSQRIQKSFLFKESEMAGYFKECFIISVPRDIVSGDFYFVTKKKHKVYIAVVDCTGHGVPGALISVIGYKELKHLIDYNDFELPQILNKLNHKINDTLNSDNAVGSDGMDLMLVEVDTIDRQIKFCGARSHCLFYTHNEFIEIKGDRKSIGEKEEGNDFSFTVHTFPFHEDDMLYMYTDGFSDQFSMLRKKMGSKLFKTILSDHRSLPLQNQKKELEDVLKNWQGEAKQTDDITLLGIKL